MKDFPNGSTAAEEEQRAIGQAYFDQIKQNLTENGVKYTVDADNENLISVTSQTGRRFFIRSDFYAAARSSYGTPEYRVGIYSDPDAQAAIKGADAKLLLMNSQRGKNGFETRFSAFLEKRLGVQSPKPLKLS